MSTNFSEATNAYVSDLVAGKVTTEQTTTYFDSEQNCADFLLFLSRSPIRTAVYQNSTVVSHLISVQKARRVLFKNKEALYGMRKSAPVVNVLLATPADFWMAVETLTELQNVGLPSKPETFAQLVAHVQTRDMVGSSAYFAALFAGSADLINRYAVSNFSNFAALGREFIIQKGGIVPKNFSATSLKTFVNWGATNGYIAELVLENDALSKAYTTFPYDAHGLFITYLTHKGLSATPTSSGATPLNGSAMMSSTSDPMYSYVANMNYYYCWPFFLKRFFSDNVDDLLTIFDTTPQFAQTFYPSFFGNPKVLANILKDEKLITRFFNPNRSSQVNSNIISYVGQSVVDYSTSLIKTKTFYFENGFNSLNKPLLPGRKLLIGFANNQSGYNLSIGHKGGIYTTVGAGTHINNSTKPLLVLEDIHITSFSSTPPSNAMFTVHYIDLES